jgi:hypothetical protein
MLNVQENGHNFAPSLNELTPPNVQGTTIHSAVSRLRSTNGNMSHMWDRFGNEELMTQIEVLSQNLPRGTEY